MSNLVQFLRRVNGATASPSTTGRVEGEMAVNMPGAAGTGTKAYIYFYDGTAWRTANPDVTITTQSVNLGVAAGGIGTAYTTWAGIGGNALTGNVVIGTYGTPSQAFVLTNPAAPGTDASWTSLGGAVAFAVAADAQTGTDTVKAINSDILRKEVIRLLGAATDPTAQVTAATSAGAADKGKMAILDTGGKLDVTLLPAAALKGTDFASAATVHAGTVADKALNPALLRGETLEAPSGTPANDADRIVRLDAAGKIAAGFIVPAPVATQPEAHAGTDAVKAITPKTLRGEALEAPSTGAASAADHDKLVMLDSNGQIDTKFLKAVPTKVLGAQDTTIAPATVPPGGFVAGDMVFANKAGTVHAGWAGSAVGSLIKSGDMLLYDGAGWHEIPNETDLNAYVPLAGTALMAGSIAWAADQTGTDIIDGKNGNAVNLHLDCGTY